MDVHKFRLYLDFWHSAQSFTYCSNCKGNVLPPANEVWEGYVFKPVCQWLCSQGGVSRPRPKGKVEVWMRGCLGPDPDPGVRLWGLAGGVQAQTRGSRPRPRDGGCPGPGPGEYICTEADPPSRWLLLWVVHILLECILVVKLISC